jgi:hypothetical protein
MEKNLVSVFKFLWDKEFIHVWGHKHQDLLIEVAY